MARKKNVQQMLRASVEAEDEAVKARLPKTKVLVESEEPCETDEPSAIAEDRASSKASNRPGRPGFPSSREDMQTMALLRERLLENGYTLNKSEIMRAGVHALLHAPEDEFREALKRLHKARTRRPLFPSARGRIQLSRLS